MHFVVFDCFANWSLISAQNILVKPDGFVDELLSRQSDRSSVEGEIDELNLELIEELPDDMSQDEKQALIDKNTSEKSQRSNLNNKKEILLGRLSSPKNIRSDQSSSSDLMNLERGLDLANQKIDLIDFFKAYPNKNIAINLNVLSKVVKKAESLKELIEFYSDSPFKKLKDGSSSI